MGTGHEGAAEGTFERAATQSRSTGALSSLQIETASVCNLRCPLCHGTMKGGGAPPFFGAADVERLLDSLGDSKVSQVNIYGKVGEPLLNPELPAIVALVKRRLPGARTRVSTNGLLLAGELASRLIDSGLDSLLLAFDGASAAAYRRYRVGGDFDRLCANVAGMSRLRRKKSSKRPRLVAQFIPMAHNVREVHEFLALAQSLGCDRARVKVCASVERSPGFALGDDGLALLERALGPELPNGLAIAKTMPPRSGPCAFDELYVDCSGNMFTCCHGAASQLPHAENPLFLGNCLVESRHWPSAAADLGTRLSRTGGWPPVCKNKCFTGTHKRVYVIDLTRSR